MQGADRKAAIAAYKERTAAAGIFALRCAETGQVWVGQAPDISAIWNRTGFALRHGSHPCRALQSAWNERGGEGFIFEELERFDAEALSIGRARILNDRLAHWAATLQATKL